MANLNEDNYFYCAIDNMSICSPSCEQYAFCAVSPEKMFREKLKEFNLEEHDYEVNDIVFGYYKA